MPTFYIVIESCYLPIFENAASATLLTNSSSNVLCIEEHDATNLKPAHYFYVTDISAAMVHLYHNYFFSYNRIRLHSENQKTSFQTSLSSVIGGSLSRGVEQKHIRRSLFQITELFSIGKFRMEMGCCAKPKN